ncbi:PREDICTED: bifunctional protein FolD 1, mitochondrial-like [Camelina sativa]|uniref:methylenetetrahydrofolate dehydrogenase (NADP(+)) n=1 Tax=Camelina sativa TaxID=90675 RepID=A0ABM1QTU7_CAMSA|nr:PREDICTED: bifunctional protein FolD 1, mitochondrial-like [Camelina sativa]
MGFSTTVVCPCPNGAGFGNQTRTSVIKGFGGRVRIDFKGGSWGRFPLINREIPAASKVSCGAEGDDFFHFSESSQLVDGRLLAQEIQSNVAGSVGLFKAATGGKVPGLGIVLVGQKGENTRFVKTIIKACEETGMDWVLEQLPQDCSQEAIMISVEKLNRNSALQGIHLENVNSSAILKIKLEKDISGVHPQSLNALSGYGSDPPLFMPPSPRGCIQRLLQSGVNPEGKHTAVIGDSIPVYQTGMILRRNMAASSFVIGRRPTNQSRKFLINSDVIVYDAAGVNFGIPKSWVNPEAVLIEVGVCAELTVSIMMSNLMDAAIMTIFVLIHTVPMLYEKYEDEIDPIAEKAVIEMKKQYQIFEAKFSSKIHH